jgi:hypothetical protein
MNFGFFADTRSLHRATSYWYHTLPRMPTVLTNLFLPYQRKVTVGMCNSYWGQLKRVKTLLEMGLVSIDDKDAVSSPAVSMHFIHSPCPLTSISHDRTAAPCWITQ